jgi:calcium-dependent protein kinase
MDKDNDSRLSKKELLQVYRDFVLDPAKAEREVDAIMESVDINKSGFIEYTEFVMATVDKKKLMSKKNLDLAFRAFDNDADGTIGVDELRRMLCLKSEDN